MQYHTTMNDIISEVENILASSEGEYDIEAIAYDVARTREAQRLDQPAYYITEDEGEFWEAVAAHALD
mgnify:CR=1 FL=1